MILIDTSAWVEFLCNTGSPACERVDAALGGDIATCDPIRMELLAGALDETHLAVLRRLIATATVIPTEPVHYEDAAMLFRTCRREGQTVRKLIGCLIAAVAIGADVPVLHRDRDFDALARHTELQTIK